MKTSATPSAIARARLAMIVSASVFGTLGPFVRRIEVASAELALYRAVLAAVFLLLSFLVTRRRLCLSEIKKSLWLLLASGAAMGINWMLLFEAYQYTTISLATLSYYLAPVIVTALCPLLFHEKMTRAQVLCFLMSTLGVALIIGSGGLQGGGSDLRGIVCALGAAVFYAAVILLNKYITGVPALERTFVQFLAAILVLAPYVALTSGFHPEVLSATGWVNLLIVGFVHTKDLVDVPKDAPMSDWKIRELPPVPEGAPIAKLLQAMQEGRTEMCVVVDEHGGTAGIVTMSDIMEQIVGRIDDEYVHDTDDDIEELPDGTYQINGTLAIDDLVELLGFEPEEANDVETAGGLLLSLFDRIPKEGDVAVLEDRGTKVTFTVLAMDRLRIDRICMAIDRPDEE